MKRVAAKEDMTVVQEQQAQGRVAAMCRGRVQKSTGHKKHTPRIRPLLQFIDKSVMGNTILVTG